MANERIKVNLIPGEDPAPIFHFSQYDNGRIFIAEMYNGEDPFECDDYNVTLECRKRDNNLVILTADTIDGNEIIFHTTEQLCACYGDNDSEIVIRDANDLVIGSGNIIINVEKSPTCGGIQSETVIENITEQIAQIVPEVIGDDYYTKSETQGLIANERTWTESQLENKADADDVYNKAQIDQRLADKADKITTYTKAQVNELLFNMLPIGQASGAIASFETEIAAKLTGLETTIVAKGGGGTPSAPIPIVGYSDVNLTRCGINHWNEQWELGTIQVSNGQPSTDNTSWRSKNYIEVVPDTTYHWHKGGNANAIVIYFYDAEQNYINYLWINASQSGDINFATLANCCYIKFVLFQAQNGYGMTYNNDISINYPSTDTEYHTYNGQTITISLGQTVYGGELDVTSGVLTITHDHIASYNGESINEPWISSMDEYVPNTSPSTGAEVVYPMTTPQTVQLTPTQVHVIVGTNNVFSACGVTTARYKDSIQHYIDSRA